MKIAWFGWKGSNSWSQNHIIQARRLGYEIEFYTPNDYINNMPREERLDYTLRKKPVPLSSIFKAGDYDMALITQTYLFMGNDLNCFTAYFHRELDMPPRIDKCDLVILQHRHGLKELMYGYDKWWGDNYPLPWMYLWCSVNEEVFYPLEKDIEGLTYYSQKESIEREDRNFVYNYWKRKYFRAIARGLPYCNNVYEGYDMPYKEYKNIIGRSEAELIVLPPFISRRLVEAAASKTLIVRWIPTDEFEVFMNKLGWVHGQTCVFYRTPEELNQLTTHYFLYKEDADKIVENAYQHVLKNHIYKVRTPYLMEQLKIYYDQVHTLPSGI